MWVIEIIFFFYFFLSLIWNYGMRMLVVDVVNIVLVFVGYRIFSLGIKKGNKNMKIKLEFSVIFNIYIVYNFLEV